MQAHEQREDATGTSVQHFFFQKKKHINIARQQSKVVFDKLISYICHKKKMGMKINK